MNGICRWCGERRNIDNREHSSMDTSPGKRCCNSDGPHIYQPIMRHFDQRLSVVLHVFCSAELVSVKDYNKLCINLYVFLLKSFPCTTQEPRTWIGITPSLHKLLGHSWELIEINDEHSLKNWDEFGVVKTEIVFTTLILNTLDSLQFSMEFILAYNDLLN